MLVNPSLALRGVEMTGRLEGCRPCIIFSFSVHFNMNMASGLRGEEGKLSHHIVHKLQAFLCPAEPEMGIIASEGEKGKRRKSGHNLKIISTAELA